MEVRQPDPLSFERLQSIAGSVLEPLATAGIVLVFVIFILFQREDLRDRFIRLVGSGDLQRTTAAMNDAARRLSRYFLFQTLMNATFGAFIAIGLWFIGVPSPFLCGALAAIMRFVPYVGAFIAAAVPILLAAAVAPGWTMMLEVAALFAMTEPIVGQLLRDEGAKAAENGDGEQHDEADRGNTRHAPAPQQPHQRRQHEAQKDGDGDRDEDGAADVKRRHDQGRDEQRNRFIEELGLIDGGGDAGRRGF